VQGTLIPKEQIGENPAYLTEQLITYIGNKRLLLDLIGQGLAIVKNRINQKKIIIADLFSGSGVVSRYCKQHASKLITNDLEDYCKVINKCYLSNSTNRSCTEINKAYNWITHELSKELKRGFISDLYSPADENNIVPSDRVFYTNRNAKFLDTARMLIGEMPSHLQFFFLAPLLSEASIHANTSGVFKGFYKSKDGIGQYGGAGRNALSRIMKDIKICKPIFSRFDCDVDIHQCDANALAKELKRIDVTYLDPPYNQHPYGSNYFMLNLLTNYQRPNKISKISGIPIEWNRSQYNAKKEAGNSLFNLISECDSKFFLISYNSEGFIDYETFKSTLNKIGTLTILETPYNAFRGSRNLANRSIHVTEFLYLLEKR
jgi:adenine-specific DNA-methyltransferase